MNATLLSIVSRNRDPNKAAKLVGPEDFECVAAGDALPEQVIDNPCVSLYALDPERQRALFVETPPGRDLLSHPFMYQAQAEHATRLIGVPYPLFFEWAERCARAKEVVLIYSSGRCGSTLLSKMLHEVDSMLSLSEPDVFTQVNDLVLWKKITAEESLPLFRAAVHHYWKGALKPGATWLVAKMRSQVSASTALLERAVPAARPLFMYRNAEDVIASYLRVAWRPLAIQMLKERIDKIVAARGYDWAVDRIFADHGHVGLQVIYWAWAADEYLSMRRRGSDVPAVRYEALVEAPDRVMGELFRRWGMSWDEAISRRVMAEDSQKGTHHARPEQKTTLSDEERAAVRQLLPKLSSVATPGEILPGTL